MALRMLRSTWEAAVSVRNPYLGMSDQPPEDRIKARLRELTEDSRRLREELEELIQQPSDRIRSFANDRPRPPRNAGRRRKPR